MNRSKHRTTTEIGDERYLVEHIDAERAENIARSRGWDGGENLLDYCDAGAAAATYTAHKTLDEAIARARANLSGKLSLLGSDIIEHEIYEQAHDDRGNLVRGGSWERQTTWEVDSTGAVERVEG